MDEQEQALAELKALLKIPGALMHITDELIDDLKDHDALPAEHRDADTRAASIARARLPLRPDIDPGPDVIDTADPSARIPILNRPSSFVRLPIIRIEGPDEKGYIKAFAEDGSWRRGKPAAVLKRLREGREG